VVATDRYAHWAQHQLSAVTVTLVPVNDTPYFRDRIHDLCVACGTPEDFNPVFAACVTGHAALSVIAVGNETKAYAVTTVFTDTVSKRVKYHLWKLHGSDMETWFAPCMERLHDEARKYNAQALQFSTQRKGWHKFMSGWTAHTIYEKAV
jgi:hypothetical protein